MATPGERYADLMKTDSAQRAVESFALARCLRIHGMRPRQAPLCRPCLTMAEHTLWIVLDDSIVSAMWHIAIVRAVG